jgi:site-specific DNA recombinase
MATITQASTASKSIEEIVAASYERVSSVPQAALGYSLGAQAADAAEFCRSRGWTLPDELRFRDGEDENASGADWDLKGLNAMLDAAREHRFQVLVVPKHDRLARNMAKGLIIVEQLKKLGVRVVFMNAPSDDTPEGRLLSNQLFAFGEFERELINFRMSRGRRAKAALNIYVGNCAAPFGYRYVREPKKNRVVGIEVVERQASIVRRLFTDILTTPTGEIARNLQREGVSPITDRHDWTTSAIRTILKNRLYAGQARYSGVEITSVPSIVTPEEYDAAQAALKSRQDGQPKARDPENDAHELRGVLRCAHCGGILAADHGGLQAGRRYYRCIRHYPSRITQGRQKDCPMPGVRAVDVERIAWNVVTDTLLDPAKMRANLDIERERYQKADERRQERIRQCDELITRTKRRISRINEEMIDEDRASETYADLKLRRADQEKELQRFQIERDGLASIVTEGLSPEEVDSLEEAARELRAGLESDRIAFRQTMYRTLRVSATVRLDPDGQHEIGKYRYSIDFDAAIPLSVDRACCFKNASVRSLKASTF